jgi:hypothetical protein
MTNVSSYSWSAPAGASVISSAGNTASFQFGTGASYAISVRGSNNGCLATSARTLTVKTVLPASGGNVSGNITVCQGTSGIYTLSGMANTTTATAYTWTASNGATLSGTGTSRTISFPNTGTSTITVQPITGTCSGNPVSLNVMVNSAPIGTFAISGVSTSCEAQSKAFSTTAVSGLNYNWSINPSTAATVTSGQGSAAVSVTFGGTYTAATTPVTISMVPSIGSCAKSASTKAVSVNKYPGLCSLSSSRDTACSGQSVVLNASSLYASTFTWSISRAANAGTGTTSSRTISMGTANVLVKVTPKNGSCSGTLVQKTILFNPVCATSRMDYTGSKEFRIFPNPATDKVYLQYDGLIEHESKPFEFRILNTSGIEVFKGQAELNETEEQLEIETSQLPSGIYLVQISSAEGTQVLRLMKRDQQ